LGKQHQGRVYRRWRDEMKALCEGLCEMPNCIYPGIPIWLDSPDPRHPLAYTVDHIIPVSAGGEHVHENGRHAHYGCNASRWTGKKRPGQTWWKGSTSSREY
jgi:5-methylcytosine-specific restriction endonuclease McrA